MVAVNGPQHQRHLKSSFLEGEPSQEMSVPFLRTAGAKAFLIFNANEMNTMTTVSKQNLREALMQIASSKPLSLRSAVAKEALGYDNPKIFFADLLQHGCITGMVSGLVHYNDTDGLKAMVSGFNA